MKLLNLRANDYPIALDQELNEAELKKHNFKRISLLSRLFIKPAKDEVVWWSKNCSLKYLNNDFENFISPCLDTKYGTEIMYGTSAYLWHKENKLIKFTFQIIHNEMAAQKHLKKFEEKLIKFIGEPTSSDQLSIVWERENQTLILEYPHRMHGYIHLLKA